MANLLNPNAAGIDISAKEHFVAVPEDRDFQNVRTFKSFTSDLHSLAQWLKHCEITSIAMESTGVYWYHLYTILLEYGFEVYLVNAYHVKNVPGRKSDVSDAQWLQQLHSFGLLKNCFQPDNLTRSLRNFVRQRKSIIQQMSSETLRMQKALEQMNIKLNNVIRDLHGKTGTAIIKAILSGERNPNELVKLRDEKIKASKEVVLKSLEGNWREEQIFNLKLAYDHYLFLEQQLQLCDIEAEKTIALFNDQTVQTRNIDQSRKSQKNQPKFNVAQYLYNSLGVDVTQIYGLKATTGLTIFSETGYNLKENFPTEKQFLSWLNLVPNNKITGGKVISSKVKRKKNRAGQAFREIANTQWRSDNPIGEFLRRKKAKSGGAQAIIATARKIAAIYYKMVTEKVEFNPSVIEKNSKEFLNKQIDKLENKIQNLKSQLAVFE
jgi:transposase